jgi:hypothetical protein
MRALVSAPGPAMVFAAPLNPIFPWGSVAALATVVLILAALWQVAGRYAEPRRRRHTRIALAGALLGELLLFTAASYASFRFAPIAYSVGERAVIVHARGGQAAVLPLSGVSGARIDAVGQYAAAYSPLFHLNQGGWRLIGPFGIVAESRTAGLGLVRVFVSDPRRAVVLAGEPPVIVSPAHPEAFAAAVNARLRNLVGIRAGP